MDTPPPTSEADAGGTAGSARPAHLRPGLLGLVWLGGTAGTGARYLLGLVVPQPLGVPVATLGINVVGALTLGVLLEALLRRGPDVGGRRALRLLLGTGFLGGFTTYSALAVDTLSLTRAGQPALSLAYAAGTVVLGGVAALAGVALGARFGRRSP